MDITELIKLYSINKKQMLLNLIHILKSTTKNVKKRKKEKTAQNFFILKYVQRTLKQVIFIIKKYQHSLIFRGDMKAQSF